MPVTVAPAAPLGVTVAPAGDTVNTALPPVTGLVQLTFALFADTETNTFVALTALVVAVAVAAVAAVPLEPVTITLKV